MTFDEWWQNQKFASDHSKPVARDAWDAAIRSRRNPPSKIDVSGFKILEAMADGATLRLHWPEPDDKTYLLVIEGLDPIIADNEAVERLRSGERKIRAARTDRDARDVYFCLTPAGYRAIGRVVEKKQ